MKKTLPILLVVIIVVAGGAFLLLGNKKKTDMNMQSNSTSNNNSQSSQTSTSDKVSIANFAFSPSSTTVKKGTTVTWTNNDSAPHTVTETDGQTGPSSQTLSNGQSYTFTFDKAGTYHYHCAIHSSMTGTVVVTE